MMMVWLNERCKWDADYDSSGVIGNHSNQYMNSTTIDNSDSGNNDDSDCENTAITIDFGN